MLYLALLAAQFGVQPILTKTLLGPEVSRATLVFVSEVLKFALGFLLLLWSTSPAQRHQLASEWTLAKAFSRALPPGVLYTIQNYLILFGSTHLSPLTLSLLNQTKTLSTAWFAYLLLGKRQTIGQIVALCGLVLGATLIVAPWQQQSNNGESSSAMGILAVATASLLSGLSSALCERALQASSTAGTSLVFSMELAAVSIVSLSSQINPQFSDVARGWTPWTWIPVLTSALGGILVGVVTQRHGGVAKGIALVFGIMMTFALEASLLHSRPVQWTDVLAVAVVCASLSLHAAGNRRRVKAD